MRDVALTLQGLDFIIRFRRVINVEAPDGQTRSAAQWLPPTGRAVRISPWNIRDFGHVRATIHRMLPDYVTSKRRTDLFGLPGSLANISGDVVARLGP